MLQDWQGDTDRLKLSETTINNVYDFSKFLSISVWHI